MTVAVNSAATGMMTPSTVAIVNPTVTASPYTYTNASNGTQQAVLVGGTMTATGVVRGGTTATTSLVETCVVLNPGDGYVVTYTLAPTLSIFQIT